MADWKSLDAALDAREAAGETVSFWWRDDDLEAPSPALEAMLALRRRLDIPLSLAIIPATARIALAVRLRDEGDVAVLQHGYEHRNHAKPGEKKAELAAGRSRIGVVAQLTEGRRRLEGLFPRLFRPVLVPPWNRIAEDILPLLSAAGYRGLSAYAGRKAAARVANLVRIDCHMDIVDWHGGRGFLGEETVLSQAISAIGAGRAVVGLLTHHLVTTSEGWDFVETFVDRVRSHRAAGWLGIDDALIASS